MSRNDSIVYLVKSLSRLKDIESADISIKALDAAGQVSDGAGAAGDVVTVSATYRVPLVAPYLVGAFANGRYEFTCSTSYRNEEFR
jgi:hypothetical protein